MENNVCFQEIGCSYFLNLGGMNSASQNVCACFSEVWRFFVYYPVATVRVFDALSLHCCSPCFWCWLSCPRNAPVLISCFWAVIKFHGKGMNNAYC